MCLCANSEPIKFEEIVKDQKWRISMDEKMRAIQKNDS